MPTEYACLVCDYRTRSPEPRELGQVRGNTARFRDRKFHLWKCPRCHSIHSVDPVDIADIYSDYALNRRRLDFYARGTLRNLERRLQRFGLAANDALLDYGCGNGIFLQYLEERGYRNARGYDPYVPEFSEPAAAGSWQCVIANDVIEHSTDPRKLLSDCVELLRPGGYLYVGMPDPECVRDMADLEPHIMLLHQPFHRIILSLERLLDLGRELGLEPLASWRRSYMDTLRPFVNYRFLDEFSKALGHDMDAMLDPAAGKVFFTKPAVLFYGLFGYFFPSAYEPAAIWRKPG